MSISLESLLNLIGNNLKNDDIRSRFHNFLESEITEQGALKQYMDECLEKGGKGGREFNNALQDIIISVGKKLGFDIEYGLYSGSRSNEQIGYDGLWKKDSGECILVEVKSSPWPVTNISNQLGTYLDQYSQLHDIASNLIFGLYIIGPGDNDPIVDQIKGSNYRNRIRLISSDDLIKLVKLVDDLDLVGGPGTGGPKVQNILLPFESVNVGDFIDLVMEIAELKTAELKETRADLNGEIDEDIKEEKVWEKEPLLRYLENSTSYQKAFLTVMALSEEDEGPLPMNLVLQRITRVSTLIPEIADDKKFTGQTIAGIRAGFKMRRDRHSMEDIIIQKNYNYSLKERYKQIVKDWVSSKNLTVPTIQQ